MVGRGRGGMPSRSGGRISQEFSLVLQNMDGRRPYHGLDQHKNYFGVCLLSNCDSHWINQTMAGKRSYGTAVATGPRQLPRCSQAPARIPFNETVLDSKQLADSSER